MDLVSLDMTNEHITFEEVARDMQQAIDRWEGGLKTTGGAIVPEKSWIYAMQFDEDIHGNMIMRKAEDIQTEFTVLDQHDIRQSLKTIDIHQGKETLGVYLSPNGNNDNATKVLKKKAEVWRDNIQTGHVDRNNAWLAVETTIIFFLLLYCSGAIHFLVSA